jgi:hypothetical protein
MQVKIHLYMEVSQGNSLGSYLKQTTMSFFQKWRTGVKTCPVWGLTPVGGRGHKERVQEVNVMEYYVLMKMGK